MEIERYLNRNFPMNIPLLESLRKGAKILKANDSGVLMMDAESEDLMLSADDPVPFMAGIQQRGYLLFIGSRNAGEVKQACQYQHEMICHQYYYPKGHIETDLTLEVVKPEELDFVNAHYPHYGEDGLKDVLELGYLFCAHHEGSMVGFIGRHMDGSMGMLEIIPEFRRQGWGERLEKALIAHVLQEGSIPYGHVVVGNEPSLRLQEKLGMVLSPDTVAWFW